jgi:hypothetical protein
LQKNTCKTPAKKSTGVKKATTKKSAVKKEIIWNLIFKPFANNSASSMLTSQHLE